MNWPFTKIPMGFGSKVTMIALPIILLIFVFVYSVDHNQSKPAVSNNETANVHPQLPPLDFPLPPPSIARMPREVKPAWTIAPPPVQLPKFVIYGYKGDCGTKSPKWDSEAFWGAEFAQATIRRCGTPEKSYTWSTVLDGAIRGMIHAPESWHNDPAVMTAYGVLQTQQGVMDTMPQFAYSFRRETLKTIYTTPVLREIAYNWAMPSIGVTNRKACWYISSIDFLEISGTRQSLTI